MSYRDDVVAWPIATAIAAAIPDELAARGLPTVCASDVVPGVQYAYDFCSDESEGVAWVRVATIFPSSTFPLQDLTYSQLPVTLAQQYEVGLIRQAPVAANGEPPDGTDLAASAELTLADAAALAAVICSVLSGLDRGFLLDRWLPVGPDGGVVGGLWTVTVKPRGV